MMRKVLVIGLLGAGNTTLAAARPDVVRFHADESHAVGQRGTLPVMATIGPAWQKAAAL